MTKAITVGGGGSNAKKQLENELKTKNVQNA